MSEIDSQRPLKQERPKPILFLDFDDVLCLNFDQGGYDARLALGEVEKGNKTLSDFTDLWDQLFDARATALLRALHDEFGPTYVVSSSWAWFFERDAIESLLRQTKLGFVADSLHGVWETVKSSRHALRSTEIFNWLKQHPEFEKSWVVLDDEVSGKPVGQWPTGPNSSFVVLCKEQVGLTQSEYDQLRAAFQLRTQIGPAYEADDGPLTAKQIDAINADVKKLFPRGKLISRVDLFSGTSLSELRCKTLLAVVEHMVRESADVEHGDFDAAAWLESWLRRPLPALGGMTPLSTLDSSAGMEQVSALLLCMQGDAFR